MRRWLSVRAAALSVVLLGLSGPSLGVSAAAPTVQARPPAQDDAPFCEAGQPPRFVFGIAALKERLGEQMGDPVECEHINAENGDTLQRTTTGLAYYRPSLSLAIFTDGENHWTVQDGQLLLWRNGSVTPPQPTATEAEYLNRTAPLRARFLTLQGRLDALRRQASAGRLDSVDVAALRSLVDELRATRDAYAAARGSGRLYRHHSMMVRSINLAMGSAEMLTQARQMTPSELRTSFLAKSTAHRQEAERLENAAADAYSQALPIAIS